MSTASGPFEPDLYSQLLPLVTAERLGSYLRASGGDVSDAFALYEWNMRAAASVGSSATGHIGGAPAHRG